METGVEGERIEGKCSRGLHGPEDVTVVHERRNGRTVIANRCNGCRRKKPNHGATQTDFHTNRDRYAKPRGPKDEYGTLWEIRLDPCHHYLLFRGLHLPRNNVSPVYCFRCDTERTLLLVENWKEGAGVSAK